MMGGEVQLESEVGVGSVFKFQLRLPIGAADNEVVTNSKSESRQVLLIDDNLVACDLIAKMMAGLGWSVDIAHAGSEAIAMVSHRAADLGSQYDLVFVDSQLAGMDGWDTVTSLCNLATDPGHSDTKYIMISAHGRDSLENRTQVEQSLLSDFIVKPVTPSMLQKASSQERTSNQTLRRRPRSGQRQLGGLRILVVEDNAINQQVAEELLSGEGALVAIAANGRLGVNAVASASPQYDIVLMDVQMPVMDGYEATQVIRESLRLLDLPIIGLTANAMASDRERCLRAGMNEHLSKPYDLAQLTSMVIRLTRRTPQLQSEDAPLPEAFGTPADEDTLTQHQEDVDGTNIAVLDMEGALDRLGGKTALYSRAARGMCNALPTLVPDLVQIAHAGQLQDFLSLLHTFKGTAATLGLMDLSAELRQFELALKSGDIQSTLTEFLPRLTPKVDLGILALNQAIELIDSREYPNNAQNADTKNLNKTVHALETLISLLEQQDMEAMEVFAKQRTWLEKLPQADFDHLEFSIQDLNFEEALALCSQVLSRLRNQ
jgi:CheY-like chemotaxis protein